MHYGSLLWCKRAKLRLATAAVASFLTSSIASDFRAVSLALATIDVLPKRRRARQLQRVRDGAKYRRRCSRRQRRHSDAVSRRR